MNDQNDNQNDDQNEKQMRPTLIVFGEILIDEFPDQKVLGGAPFNVARSLALLGEQALMISRIGRDANAVLIHDEMRRTGLRTDGIQSDDTHPTGRVLVHMPDESDHSVHSFEILTQQAYDYIAIEEALALVNTHFENLPPDLIYFGSLIQREPEAKQALMAILEADMTEGATKFLDLNLRDGQASLASITDSLNYADIVKLNEDELRFVLQHCCDLKQQQQIELTVESLQAACEKVMARFFMQALIVTLGDKGYFYLDANGDMVSSLEEGESSPVIETLMDTVGAGDAFTAMFIHGWRANLPVQKVLRCANQFAASICGVRGAVAPDAKFYQQWQAILTD
jgi:fructokinase